VKVPRTRGMFSDPAMLTLLALANFLLHVLTNDQYGFYRDELAMLDDARHLAWGYVVYPPVTPLITRLSLDLFGPSLVSMRLFAALTTSLTLVLAGLMARELGGARLAQVVAALAAAIAPKVAYMGGRLDYVTFDYLWWVLAAYLTLRLLNSEDPRWWLALGAVIGLGMMTKYTMAVFAVGLVGGVVLTHARRYLISPWLWGGVALTLLLFLPNLIWQAQHDFISPDFLSSIHAHDVAIGRTGKFVIEQFVVCTNPFTIPLWVAGLVVYGFTPAGRPYRLLGWLYVIPLGLFLTAQGRSYSLTPAYPPLFAAGAVAGERWFRSLSGRKARLAQGTTWGALVVGSAFAGALVLPIAPVNSGLWDVTSQVYDGFTEEIDWDALVDTVAEVYDGLPADEKPHTAILVGNYGEAGAINLYGPAYNLPAAISAIDSYWLRSYCGPPPETLIVVGYYSYNRLEGRLFRSCEPITLATNHNDVENKQTIAYPGVLVCRGPRQSWTEMWQDFQHLDRRFRVLLAQDPKNPATAG
jgi:4-amino-4-deoxy-L-arabinose transferase-like glycosyltransferase